jgi:hypothetical protein
MINILTYVVGVNIKNDFWNNNYVCTSQTKGQVAWQAEDRFMYKKTTKNKEQKVSKH